MKPILILLSLILLTGCSQEEQRIETQKINHMKDLKTSPDFDFSNFKTIAVTIPVTNLSMDEKYIYLKIFRSGYPAETLLLTQIKDISMDFSTLVQVPSNDVSVSYEVYTSSGISNSGVRYLD